MQRKTIPQKTKDCPQTLSFPFTMGLLLLLLAISGCVQPNSPNRSRSPAAPVTIAQATLEIRPIPTGATVQVLNIREVYSPGIALKPGRYHIKVSTAGYVTKDKWITLPEGKRLSTVFKLSPTPKPKPKPKPQSISVQDMNTKGQDYYHGRNGLPQDYKKATKWYHKAADRGYADAQFNLGMMYEFGKGVPGDYAKALELYTLAANQGEKSALNSLGLMYENGKGITKDLCTALSWYRKGAAAGSQTAQRNVTPLEQQDFLRTG